MHINGSIQIVVLTVMKNCMEYSRKNNMKETMTVMSIPMHAPRGRWYQNYVS